jgi:hypothetical protein
MAGREVTRERESSQEDAVTGEKSSQEYLTNAGRSSRAMSTSRLIICHHI